MFIVCSTVREGRLLPEDSDKVRRYLAMMEGQTLQIVFKQWAKTRSNKQNRYYWGFVIPIVRNALSNSGVLLSEEDTHYYLKRYVGKVSRVVSVNGEMVEVIDTTTALSTREFEDYMLVVRQWGDENGIYIPEPNEPLNAH